MERVKVLLACAFLERWMGKGMGRVWKLQKLIMSWKFLGKSCKFRKFCPNWDWSKLADLDVKYGSWLNSLETFYPQILFDEKDTMSCLYFARRQWAHDSGMGNFFTVASGKLVNYWAAPHLIRLSNEARQRTATPNRAQHSRRLGHWFCSPDHKENKPITRLGYH